jgi:putative ABC transport system substrate-binding protein
VIGFLSNGAPGSFVPYVSAFREGIKQLGYVEGQNVVVEYRWTEGRYDQLSAFAAELVNRRVSVIVASGGIASARAAQQATATIPIVYSGGGDPIRRGLVKSLSHPGANITGVNFLTSELAAKRLGLLRETVPRVNPIALLVNPNSPNAESEMLDIQAAARALGKQTVIVRTSRASELETGFAFATRRAGAAIISADPLFEVERNRLVALADDHKLPTIYFLRSFVAAGGLMSYGGSLTDAYRVVGVYTARILKGEKPADLPVQQSTKIELVINLKTAKALGLTIPETLLATADEVIQ